MQLFHLIILYFKPDYSTGRVTTGVSLTNLSYDYSQFSEKLGPQRGVVHNI